MYVLHVKEHHSLLRYRRCRICRRALGIVSLSSLQRNAFADRTPPYKLLMFDFHVLPSERNKRGLHHQPAPLQGQKNRRSAPNITLTHQAIGLSELRDPVLRRAPYPDICCALLKMCMYTYCHSGGRRAVEREPLLVSDSI